MKKFIIFLAVMVLLLTALTACGEKEKENINNEPNNGENNNTPIVENLNDSRLMKLLSKDTYYMKYQVEDEEQIYVIEVSKKGEEMASVAGTPEGVVRSVEKDNKVYTIIESEKMIMVSDVSSENSLEGNDIMDESGDFTYGEETIDGVEYYYENFDGGKFYFVGNDLKLIRGEGTTIKVLEFSQDARNSMFEIPTDYTEMSNPAVAGTSQLVPEEYVEQIPEDYMDQIPEEYRDLVQ